MRLNKTLQKLSQLLLICLLLSLCACSGKKTKGSDNGDDASINTEDNITPTCPVTNTPELSPDASKDGSASLVTPTTSATAANDSIVTPASAETSEKAISSSPAADEISIKYIGNSCFYITFSDGTRLVTDPYGDNYAYYFGDFPKIEADVMTISHTHEDHTNGIDAVEGDPQIIMPEQVGKPCEVGDLKITSYTSDHVAAMGTNIIYIYEENGLKIVNMGETDNIASKEALDAVKDADVILAYAGEYGTIKNKDSFQTLFGLNIKAMIPEHYSNNPNVVFYGEPTMEDILKEVPSGINITEADEFIVKKDLDVQFVNLSRVE